MDTRNQIHSSDFLLLGFSEEPAKEGSVFGLFLVLYIFALVGNLLIMLAIGFDSYLHRPMYFFLSNLSLVDLFLLSTSVPKMLENILLHKAISNVGCFAQMYFLVVFTCLDNLLLTMMAYDHFVAIFHPLHYVSIMSPQLCGLMVLLSWTVSFLLSLLHSIMAMRFSFCKDYGIPQFFCEVTQVLKMFCSGTFLNNPLLYVSASLLAIVPLTGILFSYTKIFSSILRGPSHGGKYKAFSICGYHLYVVSLFYGSVFVVYLSSSNAHSSRENSFTSMMYAVITSMLNPFIYSLRNKDIKDALRRLISRPSSS